MVTIRITASELEVKEVFAHLDKSIFPNPPRASDREKYAGESILYASVESKQLIELLKPAK